MEALETGNTLAYPLSDSRRTNPRVCDLTGPTCDSQDTILFDTALSADLVCGDRVCIGGTGAYTTAYASRFNGFAVPAVRCVTGSGRVMRFSFASTGSSAAGAGPATPAAGDP